MYKFLIPLFALAVLLVGCGGEEVPQDMDAPKDENSAGFDGKLLDGKQTVVFKTLMGDIEVELNADAAPKTVTNFVTLAKTGYYNDLTFHRVIPDFMIQGGDPNGDGTGGESVFGATFEDEINGKSYGLHKKLLRDEVGGEQLTPELQTVSVLEYMEKQGYVFNEDLDSLPMKYGYIAMANRGPNTNGSQFFIIQRKEGTEWLEGKHTVFGKVKDGMEVVDAIANTERHPNDTPVEPVTFTIEVNN